MAPKKLFLTVYWLMVVVIPLCAALQSTLQVIWRVEKQQWIVSFSPFVFYIQLKPDAVQYESDTVLTAVSKIPGLQHVQLDRTIPAWEGPAELGAQWEQLWEKYMPNFIYAALDLNQRPLSKIDETVNAIKNTAGVLSVEWDQERYAKLQRLSATQEHQGTILSAFFSIWMLFISAILLWKRPNLFQRQYAVRHGVLGAGLYIPPEWALFKIVCINLIFSIVIYSIGLSAAWFWLAFSISWETIMVYQFIIIEGWITATALPAAIMLAGWWLPLSEKESSSWVMN